MSVLSTLQERSGNCCELCNSTENLNVYIVPPKIDETVDNCAYICEVCQSQIENPDNADSNHWRCLNDSMWNENAAVKVLAYRMLFNLKSEGWPQDLLDMMYMEDEDLKWAKETLLAEGETAVIHKDSNGVTLAAGDSVVLIKDLDVKGAGFTAKRGTAVRNINLVQDNAEHIEGRVNGQQIVILTKYVKKS
ncbi:PhnA domain-containing protein [Paracrocinitomix mangrovi]|uniref:PhnA domain-containing protein n=1 Tax=Paracrocinitomix mangrovi TaxID=2862509 RepID=UPI001C8EBDBD|nr:alkylphosphonate utilization protein [Paracrocinitomix mangrovi]UKN02927.1 PhnA domain-containing protein [Paracrocinitomix mangrovi]